LVKRHFVVDSALVSLVYKDMQWFKSVQGLNACSTARDISFCGHVVLQDELFEVPDALEDPRFSDNPLVIGGPKIRFYAGVPLSTEHNVNLGTLCMFDSKPRHLSREDRRDLLEFAALAEAELNRNELSPEVLQLVQETTEVRRGVMLDQVTGCWNRMGVREVALREFRAALHQNRSLGVIQVLVEGMQGLIARYGDKRAVDVSKYVAAVCRENVRASCSVGTFGSDRFLIVLPGYNSAMLLAAAVKMRRVFEHGSLMSHGVEVQPRVRIDEQLLSAEDLASKSLNDRLDGLLGV